MDKSPSLPVLLLPSCWSAGSCWRAVHLVAGHTCGNLSWAARKSAWICLMALVSVLPLVPPISTPLQASKLHNECYATCKCGLVIDSHITLNKAAVKPSGHLSLCPLDNHTCVPILQSLMQLSMVDGQINCWPSTDISASCRHRQKVLELVVTGHQPTLPKVAGPWLRHEKRPARAGSGSANANPLQITVSQRPHAKHLPRRDCPASTSQGR